MLARWIANLRFETLPPEVTSRAKTCLLDALGCGLFGSTLPWSQIVIRTFGSGNGSGAAVIWGVGPRSPSLTEAALVNATITASFELDDVHPGALRPGSVTVPAALAAAQADPATSGRDILAGIVAGYEIGPRIGYALMPSLGFKGFYPGSICGTIASAAAAARTLRLSSEQMIHALCIAAIQASGLMAISHGGMVKRFQTGRACQNGVYAALLARQGFTGVRDILETPYGGFLSSFSDGNQASRTFEELGTRYEILKVHFKRYASAIFQQPIMNWIRGIITEHHLTPDQVQAVEVRTTPGTKLHVGWEYKPDSVVTAQMSMAYGIGVILSDGDAFIDQFTEDRIRDPQLLQLIGRIKIKADPALEGQEERRPEAVEIRCVDGRVFSGQVEDVFAGGLSHSQVEEKFTRLATRVLKKKQVERIRALVGQLETVASPGELDQLLSPVKLQQRTRGLVAAHKGKSI